MRFLFYCLPCFYLCANVIEEYAFAFLVMRSHQEELFLFSYFKGHGDGLHLAWSEDGLMWHALNGDKPLITGETGPEKLMRDPFLLTAPDGWFHLVWTAGWHGKGIGYAYSRDLLTWSFLMATAHGAGLMLLPVLLETSIATTHSEHASHMAIAGELDNSVTTAIAVVVIHTTAMLVVAGVIAIAVYEWLGLAFLRRGWINLDLVWALALIGAGCILLIPPLL